jgi:hypothetical protein
MYIEKERLGMAPRSKLQSLTEKDKKALWVIWKKTGNLQDVADFIGVTIRDAYLFKEKMLQMFIQFETGEGKVGRKMGSKKLQLDAQRLQLIKFASMAGYTRDMIADMLGICRMTFHNYCKQDPTIADMIKLGKQQAVSKVIGAVYRRAIGMYAKDMQVATFRGKFTGEKEVKKYFPPDMQAAALFLANNANWKTSASGKFEEPTREDEKEVTFNVKIAGKNGN